MDRQRATLYLQLVMLLVLMGLILFPMTSRRVMAGFTPTPTPTPSPTPPLATATPPPPPPPPPPPSPPTLTPTSQETPTPGPTATPWCYTVTPGPPPTETPAYAPRLILSVDVRPPVVNADDEVIIAITVRNEGNAPATNVVVEEQVNNALVVIAVQSSRGLPALLGQQVRVVIGTVDPGDVVQITIRALVRAQAGSDVAMHETVTATYDGGTVSASFPPTPTPPPPPTLDRPICPFLPESGGGRTTSLFTLVLVGVVAVPVLLAFLLRRLRRHTF